ncbi:MAG: hypothetical protein IPM92_07880 [Saprospiraceae bacterium]|nr:hypothetical protein [Saprospiraceae bacterium]
MFVYLGYILVLAGIYLFAKTFGWIQKKQEPDTRPEEARKIDRIIALALATICLAAGIYLSLNNAETPKTSVQAPQKKSAAFTGENLQYWDAEMKSLLIQQCLENGKRTAEKYPDLVQDYCKCATEKITLAYTPEQYGKLITKPEEEQRQSIAPVVESCVAIMSKLIELSQDVQTQKLEQVK